jgi:hypothetical protein
MERLKTPLLEEHVCRGMHPRVGAGISLELGVEWKACKSVCQQHGVRTIIIDWGLQPGDGTSSSTNASSKCMLYNSKRVMPHY